MRNKHLSARQIQALLDGGVSPEETRQFRAHVDGCARCAAELSAFTKVFDALEHAPVLRPAAGFADRVMEVAVPTTGVGGDLLERGHVTTDALLDYLDAALSPAAEAVVGRHVAACASCREQEAEWAVVFGQLGAVEQFAPSEGFRETVIARLSASLPAPAFGMRLGSSVDVGGWVRAWARDRSSALVARLRDKGRGRWAVLAGVGTAPAAVVASVAWVVFSHPLITMAGLARFAWLQTTQLAMGIGGAFLGGAVESAATYQLWAAVVSLASTPLVAVVGAAFVCAVLSSSVWVLFKNLGPIYKNLIPVRRTDGRYASANV